MDYCDKPIFIVVEPGGKTYEIWADGRVEGFKTGSIVANSIPPLIHREEALRHKILEEAKWHA